MSKDAMKDIKKLLELAARAAGIELEWTEHEIAFRRDDKGCALIWNPLFKNDDALELAIKLEMNVFHAAKGAYAMPYGAGPGNIEVNIKYADTNDDPCAATRRAITLAAAELMN
jgi:hypothetical protein